VKWWTKPFVIFGMNALAVYVMAELCSKLISMIPAPTGSGGSMKGMIYQELLLPLADPINASLMFAVGYVLLWLWVMSIFYRKKIFIKI
jgi:predicted acyltransferase